MNTVIAVIFLIMIAGFSAAIMMITHRKEKRGCGRGCATCPNRTMCYKKKKPSNNL